MAGGRRLKRIGMAAGLGVLLLATGVLGTWMAVAGPVTVARIIAFGDTTIEDHARYPGRALRASPRPHRFETRPRADLAQVSAPGWGTVVLADVLNASDTVAFVVVHGTAVIAEHYAVGHGPLRIAQTFSVSKSVLSALIGMAIDDGLITAVSDPVTRYVPELRSAGFASVRLQDLLWMRSNVDYVEDDTPFGRHVRFNYTTHLENEILALRVKPEPDARFVYKSGDNALLGLVLRRALGDRTITQYTQERLWTPLGMASDGVWSLDADGGLERTWCCLAATARDLARFGALYRDDGVWEGRRLLSAAWIRASTASGPYTPAQWDGPGVTAGFWNYGYQWWLVDPARGDYMARGKDGQFIYVDPGHDTVIVRQGRSLGAFQGRRLTTTDWVALFQALADRAATGR